MTQGFAHNNANVNITDDTTTNATMYPTWVTASSGSLPLKVTSSKLFFNPSTGLLTNVGALGQITDIRSSAGLKVLEFTYTASAVNYLGVVNAATGGVPSILATGTDTDISLILQAKGTGKASLYSSGVQILSAQYAAVTDVNYVDVFSSGTGVAPHFAANGTDTDIKLQLRGKGTGGAEVLGTSTNDNATTGYVGEFVSSVIPAASSITLTTATPANITSISLTAGDWDVWGNVLNLNDTNGVADQFYQWISQTSATIPDSSLRSGLISSSGTNRFVAMPVPMQRFLLSGTTTIYLSAYQNFGGGTATACGGIYARRVR